jgi:hypothetical protein
MKVWVIQYHHRHGVDAWPVANEDRPDLEEIENGLDDFEPETEEFLELIGPFDLFPPAFVKVERPRIPGEPNAGTITEYVQVFDPIDTCDT